jgi:hypothetical protein
MLRSRAKPTHDTPRAFSFGWVRFRNKKGNGGEGQKRSVRSPNGRSMLPKGRVRTIDLQRAVNPFIAATGCPRSAGADQQTSQRRREGSDRLGADTDISEI